MFGQIGARRVYKQIKIFGLILDTEIYHKTNKLIFVELLVFWVLMPVLEDNQTEKLKKRNRISNFRFGLVRIFSFRFFLLTPAYTHFFLTNNF